MPGAVATASPSVVIPFALFSKYSLQIQRKANVTYYNDGTSQAGALVGAERRRWELAYRLTASDLDTFQAFYVSQNGPQLPFWFYDLTVPSAVYDPTGVATTGRYAVCFDNATYSHQLSPGRASSPFALVEVA